MEVELSAAPANLEVMAPPGMEELTQQLQGMFANLGRERRKPRKMRIADALKALTDEEAARLVNDEDLKTRAVANAEANGIVFIDEIDKVASRSELQGADVSRQGVQRDLLPLVEGTTVNTKYGMVKTDHILFIASGAFHLARPSDLIPELQGRFPIRVELDSLTVGDFERILKTTDASLTDQYRATARHRRLRARVHRRGHPPHRGDRLRCQREDREHRRAAAVHGDREAAGGSVLRCRQRHAEAKVKIDAAYVDARLAELAQNEDLARYVL